MIKLGNKIKSFLPQSSFVRNVTLLAGGTALGQAIALVASPILTRLYSPEDFGILAVYSALLGIIIVVATLRFDLAIPHPKSDLEALHLLLLAFSSLIVVSIFFMVLVSLQGQVFTKQIGTIALDPYLWLIPIGLLGSGIYQILSYWAIRKQLYKKVAATKLSQSIVQSLTQVSLGFLTGPLGLLMGSIAGQTAGTLALGNVIKQDTQNLWTHISLKALANTARVYKHYPLVSSWSGLMNSLSLQLPVILLAAYYGPQVSGWYALGERVIRLPLTLIGQSISQVYFGQASHLFQTNPKAIQKLFDKMSFRLLLTGLFPLALLALLGPSLFRLIFGDSWVQAGQYMQILTPMILARFVMSPLSQTLNILQKQSLQLFWDALRLVTVTLTLVLPYYKSWTASQALTLYSLVAAITYFIFYIQCKVALHKYCKQSQSI